MLMMMISTGVTSSRTSKNNCTISEITIDNCCDLKNLTTSGVYKMNKGKFDKAANTL